ncbi:dihydroxyacetone kinase subunit DhaL [Streptomyces sp. ME02-8801-2C]|uniref:dihydroxyacetone kinase subunit DhaL n=1 Tax=Streptomyces sp. ME02-8801-2C TaxID=3028680 RepID=UPI0029B319B9|nr:dihydroxyacetone kinase subunit DhaL [Streptomyces sp. ME02-8801-2C]MDX3455874.1 dihydroxyacetone kinase subunit DhaL [Streptomyces sp. ME02-8801-2C]
MAAEGGLAVDSVLARDWLLAFGVAAHAEKRRLTTLDSAIGDGDHGVNLCRGLSRVRELLLKDKDGEAHGTVGELFTDAGALLRSHVGGASGVLYGSAFQAIGGALPVAEVDAVRFADALDAGLAATVRLGAAIPGDKTMVDAFTPAVTAFRDFRSWHTLTSGQVPCAARDLTDAAEAAAVAARDGALATIPMQARKGRASYLGPRSIGHLDPGAASTELLFSSLARAAKGWAVTSA